MPEPSAPFLFTSSYEAAKYLNSTFTKILASSLSRSLVSEIPGRLFGAWLFIEKQGGSYPTEGSIPALPVF